MVDVFISYAREDHDAAARLAKLLESSGYSVWWDPAIPPGKRWVEIIEIQLGAARCVVVLWSAVSVAKRWVRKEASFADTRNKLIPAKLEDVTIPFEFADVQAADLTGWQGGMNHGGIRHLLSAISEQVRKPRSGKKLVFIIYSHKDYKYVERVRTHFKAINGLDTEDIQYWNDTFINPSGKWFELIMDAIDSAKVAVLLVSAHFFASDFIMKHEWPRIAAARDRNGLRILPIILSPSAFEEKDGFKDLQAVNSPKEPVVAMDFAKAEGVFDDLREAVQRILDAN